MIAQAVDINQPVAADPPLKKRAVMATLARIKELKGFSEPQLARIARMRVRYYGPDEFVIREGGSSIDQMVIVLAGSVYIYKRVDSGGVEEYEQVTEITGPALVGENSFFTGLPRSAGVYARIKTPCLVFDRDALMGLVSLDKRSFTEFLRRMATENLNRAERTLVHYMGSLQIVLSGASLTQSGFYAIVEKLRRVRINKIADVDDLLVFVRDVLMLLRKLNTALEELYHFATLPEVTVRRVDPARFELEAAHGHYELLKEVVEELAQTQALIPLDSLNIKDVALTAVIERNDRGLRTIDYPAVVRQATVVFQTFISRPTDLGMDVKVTSPTRREGTGDTRLNNLLWDDV